MSTAIQAKTLALTLFLILSRTMHALGGDSEPAYQKSIEHYQIPDVGLINQDRKPIRLRELLTSNEPVLVSFLFTTCTTICPIQAAIFADLQKKLGEKKQGARLVSISIDPDADTPLAMKEYLQRFRAQPGWDFLTGKRSDIDSVLAAFNAFNKNKMAHRPLALLKRPGASEWIRISQFANSSQLLKELNLAP